MRNMRRVQPAHGVPAELQDFAIRHWPWRSVCYVVHRNHRGNLPAHRDRSGCCREKLVQCSAFIRLEVRERDVAEAIDGHYALDRLAYQWKHPSQSGVEDKRLVIHDEILVEIE